MRRRRETGIFTHAVHQLTDSYRHLQQEHQRQGEKGTIRRKIRQEMSDTARDFEQLTARWLEDDSQRREWIRYFYHGGPFPEAPKIRTPPEFMGITEEGARIEIYPSMDGGHDIVIDGSVESHEPAPFRLDEDQIEPFLVGTHECYERFAISEDALSALKLNQTAPHAEPLWKWSRPLYEEGIVDEHFNLTARGARALRARVDVVASHDGLTYGILVAESSHGRVLLLSAPGGAYISTFEPMVELAQMSRPDGHERDSTILSDSRPGLQRERNGGQAHGLDDRREGHRRMEIQRFAGAVADETSRVWRQHGVNRAIIAAGPKMLGALRAAFLRLPRDRNGWSLRDVDRDVTQLTAPALHQFLAWAGLVPAPARMSAVDVARKRA